MHELIVPILQGFDSVHLKSDIEIGGTDQLFNFKISRQMQELFHQEPENCFLMPIINGTDGRKMSKSFGNCIFINDEPQDIFGKVMSISDTTMHEWIPLFFDSEIEKQHPIKMKKVLAHKVTELIWGTELADKARNHFESVIQGDALPEVIDEIELTTLVDSIMTIRKSSRNEARRLLKAKAVKVNGEVALKEEIELKTGDIIRVGKRDLGKIK